MGKTVESASFVREDYRRYRRKVRRCLDVFAQMLDDFAFDEDKPMTGLEIELNLDRPATASRPCATPRCSPTLATRTFQTELGLFNLELNVPPRLIAGDGFDRLRARLRGQPGRGRGPGPQARRRAGPDRDPAHADAASTPCWTTSPPTRATASSTNRSSTRAATTSRSTSAASSGCRSPTDSIAAGGGLHQRAVPPAGHAGARSPHYWNASQAIAGVQVAVGANSPYLFGRRLWDETRIALFEQATDTRPDELKNQGVRPRVWFGERWITSIFDLFEENVRYFPAAAADLR